MFWGSSVLAKILYVTFLLFVLIIFQCFFSELVTIKGIGLDLAVLILVYVGLTKGPAQGAIFGFLVGLLLDVFTPERLGLGALIKSLIGFAVGNFKDKLFLESSYSKGAIVFLSVALNGLLYHLFSGGMTAFTLNLVLYHSLPSALYTGVAGILLLVVLEKKFPLKSDIIWKG